MYSIGLLDMYCKRARGYGTPIKCYGNVAPNPMYANVILQMGFGGDRTVDQ